MPVPSRTASLTQASSRRSQSENGSCTSNTNSVGTESEVYDDDGEEEEEEDQYSGDQEEEEEEYDDDDDDDDEDEDDDDSDIDDHRGYIRR